MIWKSLLVGIAFCCINFSALALDLGVGMHQYNDKTQDQNGNDERDPYSPSLSIGHKWNIYGSIDFAPRFGYIKHTNTTDDRYGGDYTVESFYLLYDFTYPIMSSQNFKFLYGFGNFRKTVTGKGGDVTVPNGNSSLTAYRPDKSKATYTLSLDLGLEYLFNWNGSTITNQGLSAELFVMQPFNKEKRMYAMMVSYLLQF